jgi:hypothetical protein
MYYKILLWLQLIYDITFPIIYNWVEVKLGIFGIVLRRCFRTIENSYGFLDILFKYVPYHWRFIPRGVAKASQTFLHDAQNYQNYLAMRNAAVFFFFSYPSPTKWGLYNIFSSCCDKDSAIVFTTGLLPDVNPYWEWIGCKRLLPKYEGA